MKHNAVTIKDATKTYTFYRSQKDRVKELFHPFQKKYHELFYALQNVSLTVEKGDTVGIVGRNGSGKSTLLQLICGISQPTSGEVKTDGRISALLELGAGFNPEFSGRENVYINASIMGLSDLEIDERLSDILAFSEIGEFIDKPVKTYSSGMYVRLAFSIAINVKPDILIIDEALSVGDVFFQAKCFRKFREFQENGVTIIFVAHDMDAITRYCQKVYLLDYGKVKSFGDPKTVVDEYHRLIVGYSGNENKDNEKPIKTVMTIDRQPLFMVNPGENRYGNGRADIFEAGIFSLDGSPAAPQLFHGMDYDFKLRVRFRSKIISPIFSFTVKDPKGFDISGSNTLYKKVDTGTVDANDVIEVNFRHKMILNPGKYLLSFGCAGFEDGEYVIYDRRFDLLSFQVTSSRDSVGIFDMDSEIIIHKNNLS